MEAPASTSDTESVGLVAALAETTSSFSLFQISYSHSYKSTHMFMIKLEIEAEEERESYHFVVWLRKP